MRPATITIEYNIEGSTGHRMERAAMAYLFLNETNVGTVYVHGSDYAWNYGDFRPGDEFAQYAPLFGRWSLLMHADDDADRLSEAAAEELRQAENAIDKVRARLFVPELDQWHELSQLNIDGPLIEWKVR